MRKNHHYIIDQQVLLYLMVAENAISYIYIARFIGTLIRYMTERAYT
jgi:hypothetical protein